MFQTTRVNAGLEINMLTELMFFPAVTASAQIESNGKCFRGFLKTVKRNVNLKKLP